MTAPATSKRLKVVDRFITVLQAIHQGTVYHYTPYQVSKRLAHYKECGGFPFYMVHVDGSQGPPEQHLDNEYVETVAISVKCYVNTELGEAVTKLEKCLQDVRRAINLDSKSTDPESLGVICGGYVDLDTVETDSGYLSLEGFGFFDQRVLVRIVGDWGEI
jgi:hypothetical protein